MRRPMPAPPMNGPRFNEFIQSPKVRVIDHEGENLGVMYTREAMEQAMDAGYDLVEISPNADPPVAKFLDIGKFKYEAQKKANAARKNQKAQEIKEIKMRPNIDDHDYETKMKAVHKFLGEGEWKRKKHGAEYRREWRKVHLGIDAQTLEIRAIEVTSNAIGDAPMLPELLARSLPTNPSKASAPMAPTIRESAWTPSPAGKRWR